MNVDEVVTINRPPEELYFFWRNFGHLPRFMPSLVSVKQLDARRSHWTAKALGGRTIHEDLRLFKRLMEAGEVPSPPARGQRQPRGEKIKRWEQTW